jgi:BED zinc finger
MVLVVKCLICNKELNYTHSDPSELIQHVKTEHPLVGAKERKSEQSRRESKEKAANDLKHSLKRNSDSLRSLIDKEIQTEIDWKYFQKMSSKRGENTK